MYLKNRFFKILSTIIFYFLSVFTLSIFAFPICIFSNLAFAGSNDLEQSLAKLASQSDGRIGICALDIKLSQPICINGDQKFSLQSVMKLIATAAVLDAIDRKQLMISDQVVLKPEHVSPGPQDFADIIKGKGSLKVTIEELIQRAVIDSDSTSVDFLIGHIGGISVMQGFLKRRKLEEINIQRDEKHLQAESLGLSWRPEFADSKKFQAALDGLPVVRRDAAWEAYLKDSRDTATPKVMVGFLKALGTGKLLSEKSTRMLLDVMARTQTGRDRLMAGVPKDWSLGHKTGTSPSWKGMAAALNDVGILTAPDGEKIAVAVFVAESRLPGKDRAFVISETARLVTNAYGAKKSL